MSLSVSARLNPRIFLSNIIELAKLSTRANGSLKRDEKNPGAHRNLGARLAKAGRTEEGEKHFRHAAVPAPDDQQAMFGFAETLSILGRRKEADEAYQKTIDINEFGKLADLAKEARRKAAERRSKSEPVVNCIAFPIAPGLRL